jgi:D-3-phosphoglycerate dehydrogenase
LGLNTDDYGCTFWWKDKNGADCATQWSLFKSDADYFKPLVKEFMQHFRVENIERLLEQLKAESVTIASELQSHD